MPLTSIRIQDFRNIEALQAGLSPGLNVLEGENAQGKTNFLEAIYYLANGRSFRSQEIGSLIRFGASSALLEANLAHQDLASHLALELGPEKRDVRLHGKPLQRWGQVHELLRVLIFTPDSSALFRSIPSVRRRYFDHAIGVHQPAYSSLLSRYTRILRQRNELLEMSGPEDLLEGFDRQWAEAAHGVMLLRREYLQELLPRWSTRLEQLGGMDLSLRAQWERSATAQDLDTESILQALARGREEERRARRTLRGPPRDDLKVQFGEHAVREVASQGQQRVLVIALKLAEADLFQQKTGRAPVFLLDDLGSELDRERQRRLLQILGEISAQTILTTTQQDAYDSLHARTFLVHLGKIKEKTRDP